jgi:acylphosphatase
MKRIILLVSGKVQQAGYRDRVIELGKNLGLTGYAENLPDGMVKIVAEGDENKLEIFKEIVNIKNTLINVEYIEHRYTESTGEFSSFHKLVSEGETDARLDTAANLMKELIVAVKSGFNGTIEAVKSVKEDTSKMLEKQDKMLDKQDESLKMQTMMLDKQDESLKMQTMMLDKQDESLKILNNINNDTSEIKFTLKTTEMEIKDTRFSLTHLIETKFKEHDADIAQIKTTLAKVQEAIKAT